MSGPATIKALPTQEEKATERIVNVLQDALDRAKKGEFRTVLLVTACGNNAVAYALAGDLDSFETLGQLDYLKRKVMDRVVNEEDR